MKNALDKIMKLLNDRFHFEISNGHCYISQVDWGSKRINTAPLWMNAFVDGEILACDICNSPQNENARLDVSFFWRDNAPSIKEATREESTSYSYWSAQNKLFPKGFMPCPYKIGTRLHKQYDISVSKEKEIVREIVEVYRLFGV